MGVRAFPLRAKFDSNRGGIIGGGPAPITSHKFVRLNNSLDKIANILHSVMKQPWGLNYPIK